MKRPYINPIESPSFTPSDFFTKPDTRKREELRVKFYGVDDWNRPVFKAIQKKNFYGSLDKLFGRNAKEAEVMKTVTAKDLCFFGNRFNCEPMGTGPEFKLIIES